MTQQATEDLIKDQINVNVTLNLKDNETEMDVTDKIIFYGCKGDEVLRLVTKAVAQQLHKLGIIDEVSDG